MVPTCFLPIILTRKGKGDTQYGTQKKSRREKQKPRKNRPPLAKQRVVGTGPRTREEAGNGGETQVFPPGQDVPECIMQIIAMPPSEDGVEGEPPFIRAGQRAPQHVRRLPPLV